MEDSRDSFSFEIDDLSNSSANSELFGSGEMADISELLEDFGNKRDDERSSEDLRVSSEESKTKDLKSRIPILKERGMLDDRMKSESLFVSTSKIPVRVSSSSSSTANRITDKEQFKRKDSEKMEDGSKASEMKQEEIEPEDSTSFNPESVRTSLRRQVAVGEEENMKSAAKKSSVNSLDVDERVEQESNLGLYLNSVENSTPKENVESCHERLGEKCDESIGTKSEIAEAESTANSLLEQVESKRAKNYQNSKIFSMTDDAGEVMSEIEYMSEKETKQNVNVKELNGQEDVQEMTSISLGNGETKRKLRNQEDEISNLMGVDSEIMAEKELMNENQSVDQNVKNMDLNGQERVKNEKHSDDIVIPSLSVDDEGSDEDSLNNGNDKMTKNYMSNGIFVKCTNQGESIDFDSPPLKADNEEVNKEHSNFKNCEKNEECGSQEDIATPSLVHDDQSRSDDIEKLKDKNQRKTKKNSEGSSFLNLKEQENVTAALVAPEGSDVGKADDTSSVLEDQRAWVCEANLVPNTEVDPSLTDGGDSGGHEPNHEERTKIHDLNDGRKVNKNHDGISSTCDDDGGARAKDNKSETLNGNACAEEAQNGKTNDLDKLTTRDDVELSSIVEDVEGMGEGKLCYGKDNTNPEETTWNKSYLTKTECNIDDFEGSVTLVPDNGIVRKINTGNDQSKHESKQQSEHLSDGVKEHDMTYAGHSHGACLADDGEGEESTMKDKKNKSNYEEKKEEVKAELGIIKDLSSNSDGNLQNVHQNRTKFETESKDNDDSDKSWDDSNIEFDDADNNYDVPDYGVKYKKPANSFSKAAPESIEEDSDTERKYGKKENDEFTDEANTSDYEMLHESKIKSTEKPRCIKDIEKYEVEQIPKPILAECPKINCLEVDGTNKSGKKFPFNKNAPVPAPRKKKKPATAALTSRENNVNSNETIASNEELKEKYNDFSSEISCKEKPQHRNCENVASAEKEKAVLAETKGGNVSSKFEREHNNDDDIDFKRKADLIADCKDEYQSEQHCLEDNLMPHNKGHIVGPTEKFATNCPKTEEPLSSEKIPVVALMSESAQTGSKSDQFKDVAAPQTLHENEPQIEYREEEKIERYDSENYLLPQDISAFRPPFCSTPYSERVSNINPEVQAPFDKDKFIGNYSEEAEPNGQYELPNKRQISSQENKDEAEINYGKENGIKIGLFSKGVHYEAKLTEDDGAFNKCMKNDVGYEDDESIYATSIDFENPSWRERNIAAKSPEYEEVNVGLRGGVASFVVTDDVTRNLRKGGTSCFNGDRKDEAIASFRHSNDTMKRGEERNIGNNKDHDGPIWRTEQSSRKGQSPKPGAMGHQRPSVQMTRGVNLCGIQPYGHDLLKLPCINTDQTSHRLSKSTEIHYLGKPLVQRNSAFVPFASSVRGRDDYPKKRGSPKEKKWNGSTEECNKDRNRAGYMKYTSDSNQNPIELVQKKSDKFGYEDCLPTDARYASQRTSRSDDTSFAMPGQLNYNTEPRIERCFDHVQHSKTKSEINLSGFGSQIGTLDVQITFPLSRGPGIAVERGDNGGTSGIYVKEIIEDGDAYHDGRLRPGDRLLTINGYNLSIASLSQAKSVLRKLKHAQSESFATIRFVRDSDDISVDDGIDSSLDRSVTLPISPNETTHIEENTIGKQHVHHDSSYLKEELILPNPLMTSTPNDVYKAATGSRKSEDHAPWSVNFYNLQDGLLMIPPNTKVHLSQLESSLSFLGLSFSPHQKDLLRNQLEVDSQGYVVYEDFATAARGIYSLDLSVKEPLYLEQEIPKSLPDIVPRPSIDSVLASRRELDQLVSEKDQIKEEIQEIKKRLTKKAKVLRNMEDELAEVRNGLKQVQNRKMILIKDEREVEKARARASSKTQDYKTVISSLEQEIINLKALKVVPITSQLVSKCASVNKQIQNLVMRVRSVEKSNRNYQYVTQKLMAFAHTVHKLQHEGATSSLDHTYQTVDQIPVLKSRGVKSRDRKFHNQNEFLSREARKVISSVQGIISHEPLPFGWEEAYTEKGSKFYIDHVSGVTTWRVPTSTS